MKRNVPSRLYQNTLGLAIFKTAFAVLLFVSDTKDQNPGRTGAYSTLSPPRIIRANVIPLRAELPKPFDVSVLSLRKRSIIANADMLL
jgi:hypothetical protein